MQHVVVGVHEVTTSSNEPVAPQSALCCVLSPVVLLLQLPLTLYGLLNILLKRAWKCQDRIQVVHQGTLLGLSHKQDMVILTEQMIAGSTFFQATLTPEYHGWCASLFITSHHLSPPISKSHVVLKNVHALITFTVNNKWLKSVITCKHQLG